MLTIAAVSSAPESLLVFSDVHLGSDLNDSGKSVPRSVDIDRDLAAFLAHYREAPPPSGRWRLVIAGDFVDFVGMSVDVREGDVLETEPTPRERAFGLGGAEDHARLKLRRAALRHRDVFVELGKFVAKGHGIASIMGNHDLELHWDSVKDDFRKVLHELGGSSEDRATFDARIDFHPWFFYREGFVYVEHGHQYDPFCSSPYLLAPLSPRDPKRVLPSLSDHLLRYIVRRTPGMKEYGHETRGLWSYISWGLALGMRGAIGLYNRFWAVVFELRDTARAYQGEGGARLRKEHEKRLTALAEQVHIPEERLRRAIALHPEPMSVTVRGVLASVMLDRLAVFTVMIPTLVVLAIARVPWQVFVGLAAVWVLSHIWFSRGRPSVDPGELMAQRAEDLAKLFPASFVVMGHTHVPHTKPLGNATYVNLGSWAEEEPDPKDDPEKVYRAARTHLVVHENGGRHEAHFFEWCRKDNKPRRRGATIYPLAAKEQEPSRVPPAEGDSSIAG